MTPFTVASIARDDPGRAFFVPAARWLSYARREKAKPGLTPEERARNVRVLVKGAREYVRLGRRWRQIAGGSPPPSAPEREQP